MQSQHEGVALLQIGDEDFGSERAAPIKKRRLLGLVMLVVAVTVAILLGYAVVSHDSVPAVFDQSTSTTVEGTESSVLTTVDTDTGEEDSMEATESDVTTDETEETEATETDATEAEASGETETEDTETEDTETESTSDETQDSGSESDTAALDETDGDESESETEETESEEFETETEESETGTEESETGTEESEIGTEESETSTEESETSTEESETGTEESETETQEQEEDSSEENSSEEEESSEEGSFKRVVVGDPDNDMYMCNDGTEAVYYISYAAEDSPNRDRWLIQLPGGGSCGTFEECASRWNDRPDDMTTTEEEYMEFDEEGGLMASDPDINPHFYNYNRVRLHYCSSDSWMGQARNETNDCGWHFLGARIAFQVIEQLSAETIFRTAKMYVFDGVSVGGTGILNLADEFDNILGQLQPNSERFYISDCGWTLLEWMCYDPEGNCTTNPTTTGLLQQHNPFLNENCAAAGYNWECYYPEFMFSFINVKDRMAVAQQMYDSQMMPWAGFKSVSIWDDDTIDWCYERTEALIESFEAQGVKSIFSSNCRTHDFTEHQSVYNTTINEVAFADYFNEFINSGGDATFWQVDEDHYPEANPTCQLDLLG